MKKFPNYEEVFEALLKISLDDSPWGFHTVDEDLPGGCIWLDNDTRGAHGGSCWDEADDEGAVEYYNGEDDRCLISLVLAQLDHEVLPDVFDLLRERVKTDQHSYHEYYGNYSIHDIQWISREVIAQILSDRFYDV